MSYTDRDTYGMYKDHDENGPGPRLMGADTLIGDDVYNLKDEDLGDIKEIMLDVNSGRIAYAVLSFGGFLGIADKLFAVPWSALKLDTANKRFLLDIDKKRLESAPGFNKDDWPDMADPIWQNTINSYYGAKSYKDSTSTVDTRSNIDTKYPTDKII
ncbi:MAG: PRC-barrel domain-containing protein [Nitrosospira sp.]